MDRFKNISPFIVMDILDKARRMEDVVHLEIGEPDLDAPPSVIDAFAKAVRDGKYKYTSALGLMELREAISSHYHRRYGLAISPERIAITPGTSGAFLIVYAMLVNSGQKIALSDPSYPCYKNFAYILDLYPVFVPVSADTGYCMTIENIKKHSDIRAIQVSSPSNPLGNMYGKDNLADLIEYARQNDIFFISDEIYHGLVYDEQEHTALEFNDNVIVINGFSKYYCMPGFRIGWMILPENLVRNAEMAIQNVFIAANTPAQYAAVSAFDETYLKSVRDEFKRRRDYLYSALKDVFFMPIRPSGAFYVWAGIEEYGLGCLEFCDRILETSRVAVTPGIDFGSNDTDRFIRLAFTQSLSRLEAGVERIRNFLAGLQN